MKMKNVLSCKWILSWGALFAAGCDLQEEADIAPDDYDARTEEVDDVARSAGDSDGAGDAKPVREWGEAVIESIRPKADEKFLSSQSGYQHFTWKKGMPPVKMGAVGEKVCLLSSVHGIFAGSSDMAEAATLNGEYLLRGLGGVAEVTAVCLSTHFVKHTATYITEGSKDVSSTLDRACFLASVRGRFNGSVSGTGFTGAEVTKNGDSQRWRVRVAGVGGNVTVRCITGAKGVPLKYSSEASWLAGQGAAQLESKVSQPCLLTRLSGNFSSGADWAGLWLQERLDGVLQQVLGGYAVSSLTSAASRCVST